MSLHTGDLQDINKVHRDLPDYSNRAEKSSQQHSVLTHREDISLI